MLAYALFAHWTDLGVLQARQHPRLGLSRQDGKTRHSRRQSFIHAVNKGFLCEKSFKARVWDISGCDLLHTLASHKEAVFCVDMFMNLIATGSADKVG